MTLFGLKLIHIFGHMQFDFQHDKQYYFRDSLTKNKKYINYSLVFVPNL